MRVTLKDVAKVADVSIKTVSRVINDQGEIREDTRQRVQKAIDELGYQPNRLARALLVGKTNLLGIIIPDIMDPFFSELILSAENTARQHDYSIVLCNANRDPEEEVKYINILAEHQVDGFLIAGSRLERQQLSELAQKHKMVVISPSPISAAEVVTLGDYTGMRELCRYILSLGHTRIGFLGRAWEGDVNNRYNGIADEYHAAGYSPENIQKIMTAEVSIESGEQLTKELLEQRPDLTALFCYNDVLALGALQACLQMGRKVPDNLSIVGFDDIPEARRSSPALTTYRIDRQALGTLMMEKLIQRIERGTPISEPVIIQGEIIIRKSCQAAG
jgi:LacI family transcriptional regulator